MEVKFRWTCPYCGLEQAGHAEISHQNTTARDVVYCDNEEGGCDQPVAIFTSIIVAANVYKLDLGEQEPS